MSKKCLHSNNLQRSGTSRQQRQLKALLPGYVSVDERKIEDLKAFVSEYAQEIRFYKYDTDINNLPTWEHFFDKKVDPKGRTDPHYALFHAFLQLFKIAQNDLNQITQKHLDFYYRDVLQLKEKRAKADQAFIIFELAKHVHQHLIPKGTRLKAGKDDSGKELIYQTDRDIVLNKGVVGEMRSLFKDKNGRIFTSPIANSADGQGAEIETNEMNWQTFGKPIGSWPDQDRPQAEIGFAIASPLLFLAEGDRDITLTISLRENSSNTLTSIMQKLILHDAFRIRFSGEDDWIEAESNEESNDTSNLSPATLERILSFLNSAPSWKEIAGVEPQAGPVFDDPFKGYSQSRPGFDIGQTTAQKILAKRETLGADGFTTLDEVRSVKGVGVDKINDLIYSFRDLSNSVIVDPDNQTITIKRVITKAQDPIVGYQQNGVTLIDPFVTDWPVMKCTLQTTIAPYFYDILQEFEFKKLTLSVHVSEVRELIVQNDQSVLDPGKDFQPFGMRPVMGSNLYVGSQEAFSKRLDMLNLKMKWHDLPETDGGFEDFYGGYLGPDRSNSSFLAKIDLLDKKSWVSLHDEADASLLFSEDGGALLPDHTIAIGNTEALAAVRRNPKLPEFEKFDTDTRKGFLRLQLTGTDFGHKDYQSSYAKAVMGAFKADGTFDTTAALPNEPYTPLLKELVLSYSSSEEILPGTIATSDSVSELSEQFFHVGAFGVSDQTSASGKTSADLMPHYTSEGTLCIGVENFDAGSTLSLLFQVAEGSADPDLKPQTIHWSYLADNVWVEFESFDILSDSTSGLLTSGIIQFSVPKQATDDNTLLPEGYHWLRAAVDSKSDAVSDLIQISTQAVPATFKDNDNDPGHLEDALPAETISKLKEADSAVNSIIQPFSSFGGAVTERKNAFYTRVSERLRHKNRAITIWDHERIVLEAFPSVYKVKCLNHTRYSGSLADYSELAPGHVTLVVISNVRNVNAVDPLRPKTSLITLTQISDYLSTLNPAGVDLHVKNPIYEEIEVSLNVKFHTGFDSGFYGKQLEDDLKTFLSPWASDSGSDLELGGKVHKSVILNYVEERAYVDFLTCFEMSHIVLDPTTGEEISRTRVEEAEASTSVSILGSAGQTGRYGDHIINVLETENCDCDTNDIESTASIASIDDCGCNDDKMLEL